MRVEYLTFEMEHEQKKALFSFIMDLKNALTEYADVLVPYVYLNGKSFGICHMIIKIFVSDQDYESVSKIASRHSGEEFLFKVKKKTNLELAGGIHVIIYENQEGFYKNEGV